MLTALDTSPTGASTDSDPRSMVARICAILAAFRPADRALSIAEIARRAELPTSTVSRIVHDLVSSRMLERDGRRVRPGIRLFEFGEAADRPHQLRRASLTPMRNLRDILGLTVHLAMLEHDEVLYIEVLRARKDGYSALPSRVARMPAHATAVGKALLAWSTQEVVDRVVGEPLRPLGPRTITRPARLLEELRATRREGFAIERGESRTGVTCIAVPVLDAAGAPVVALSVMGRDPDVVPALVVPALRAAGEDLRRQLDRVPRLSA